ncbi:FHA domain-containing protein [Streptomyces sp. NPDC004830]
MQIRLTVVDPLGASAPGRDRAPRSDVLVTAPAGTALAAVASALAQSVSGGDGSGTPVLYAGEQRLDAQRCTLGEPPLTDGAVLSVGAPGEPEPHPELADAPAQLQVVAGPDAGGVHLLHGGEIRIGRSADADVPLDDPDVSRLHCAVTVGADGRVSVADLDSTNGTTLDGVRVGGRAVGLAPGALLRIGESALRLAPAGGPGGRVATTPDGEGHVRVPGPSGGGSEPSTAPGGPSGPTYHGYGPGSWGASSPSGAPGVVPGQGAAPRIENEGAAPTRESADGRGPGRAPRTSFDVRPSGFAVRPPEERSGPSRRPGESRASSGGDGDTHAGRSGFGVFGEAADVGGTAAAPGRAEARPAVPQPRTTDGAATGAAHRRDDGVGGQDTHRPTARAGAGVPGQGDDSTGARGTRRPGAADPRDRGADPWDAPRSGAADHPDRGADPWDAPWAGAADPHHRDDSTGARGTHRPGATDHPDRGADPWDAPWAGAADPHHRDDSTGARGTHRPGAGGPGHRDDTTGRRDDHRSGGRVSDRRDEGAGDRRDEGAGDRGIHAADARVDGPAVSDERVGGRKGTPLRGTDVPSGTRRRGLGAWARRLAGGRGEQAPDPYEVDEDEPTAVVAPERSVFAAAPVRETWPDPAALLLTALGPGPRLWERGPGHSEALAVRLGTADRPAPDGSGLLPAVPMTVGLREVGALGLAGPRARLAGLARAVLAQLAALHSPDTLEIVLIAADRSRPLEERAAEWSWLGWLPHVRPGHGQDCRLLLAHDREQAAARTDELTRRLEDQSADAVPAPGDGPSVPAPRRPSWARDDEAGTGGASPFPGPYTVLVVDGDPGGADLRGAVARLALEGPRAGIHVLCLAETAAASPASPVTDTYEAACAVAPTFRQCGAVALLSGDVATALRLVRVARAGGDGAPAGPVGHGTIATVDAVSPAWAERFARALAPLRTDEAGGERQPRVSAPLPQSARLLDELGLARATPASLMARWADAADDTEALGGRVRAVLGAGPRGPVCADLAAQGPHLLVEGPPGSGRTELLRAVVASLAAAERPDRLGIVLVDGRGGPGAGGGPGDGLRLCTDVPHVTTYLTAHDPVLMREFAQSLSAELKRRSELLGRSGFAEWHTGRELSGRMVTQRTATGRGGAETPAEGAGDLDSPSSSTIRLRPGAGRRQTEAAAPPLPRLVVVVDDLDALVSPALGSTGRPAAGSVMRALEAVAREGERLGVHLVAATGPCPRTAETEPARRATLRVTLDEPVPGPDEPAPGRGSLTGADGRGIPFQGGRVTGRIPRTATLRPTVVPLEWHRMGDPPARRPVRELGNGPTDLALLASALERAAREVAAVRVPSLL